MIALTQAQAVLQTIHTLTPADAAEFEEASNLARTEEERHVFAALAAFARTQPEGEHTPKGFALG